MKMLKAFWMLGVRVAVGVAVAAAANGLRAAEPPPPKPAEPLSAKAAPLRGAAMKVDIEELDATIQKGLDEMAQSTSDFAAERQKWKSLDKSMESARSVNAALLARNKQVVSLFDAKLEAPLERFRQRLREAPTAYREMAEERRRLLAASTLDVERANYLSMVETCEAAALLCERRLEELFGEAVGGDGFGNRSRVANATSLRRTIDNMRKLQTMHVKWEETFNAYPTALESPTLTNWFTALSLYSEDLEAFSKNVDGLKETMKQKAGPAEPKANEGGEKQKAPGGDAKGRGPTIKGIIPETGPDGRVTYYVRK